MGDCTNNALVTENLGLVHSCANRFRGSGVEYDDLFQAGCVGLVKAAKELNIDKSEVFVIGDDNNDISMFEIWFTSFDKVFIVFIMIVF